MRREAQGGWRPRHLPLPGQELSRNTIVKWLGSAALTEPDVAEKKRAWGNGFAKVGALLAAAVGLVLFDANREPRAEWGALAILGGVVFILLEVWHSDLAWVFRESRPQPVDPNPRRCSEVEANAAGLHVMTGVLGRRIEWWQVRGVDETEDLWTVRWDGGAFRLDPNQDTDRRIRKAILGVLAARDNGCLIPGQPFAQDIPETALSRARMVEPANERGLSRVDVEAED